LSRNSVIYAYPLLVDIIVALMLFVGRHSLAGWGYDERTVGSVLLYYGIGYCVASLSMRHVVRIRYARWQMGLGLAGAAGACGWLAGTTSVGHIQATFALVPVAFSLFFNAFQAYMLDVSDGSAKPLAATAGHYTVSWSLGYALGPLLAGLCREYLGWAPIYMVAGGLALALAATAVVLRPDRPTARTGVSSPRRPAGTSLVGAAWVGVGLAWAGWNALATFWPVQAVQLGFTPRAKSGVEFAFAVAQSLGALGLVYAGAWHHKPGRLPVFGAIGIAGVSILAGAQSIILFVIGVLFYGIYTSSAFTFMVYHSMFDPERAVRRVAFNETVVGLSFLAGPLVAQVFRAGTGSFAFSYLLLGGALGVGIGLQTLYAARLAVPQVQDS